jgi:methylenetetrahydrofolate reductase (NADPH)
MNNLSFREMMSGQPFYYGVEVVTNRGKEPSQAPSQLVEISEQLLNNPRIGWISITDNPGGNPMLPPGWLAGNIPDKKDRIVLHFTCKDLNRNGLEATAWRYASEGFNNLLAMTGDYPTTGYGGTPAPVFDLGSIGLITTLNAMNQGLEVTGRMGKTEILPKTDFFIGCVVSPFKRYERELMPQYFKLLRKISCGAHYVITQLGYDMRKFYEVKLWLARHGIDIPVVGYVFLLNRIVAGIFHRSEIPGAVVSDELLALALKHGAAPDKGRSFFRELAAKQLAVFKGLGFAAGYIGGITKIHVLDEIIHRAESFGENDWREFAREIQYPRQDEFYLFEKDPQTGFGDPNRINQQYLKSLEKPLRTRHVTLGYKTSCLIHKTFFTPNTFLYRLMQRIYRLLDGKLRLFNRPVHILEKILKYVIYRCRDCGDCSLPDCAFICPIAKCAKFMRNGPCGGSIDGRCELDDKECIWAKAYERMKYYHKSEQMLEGPTVYYDASLKGTSSWANTYLGRDHLGIQQKEKQKEGEIQ